MAEEKFHYYLDLNDRYVYFYEPVNVEYFAGDAANLLI